MNSKINFTKKAINFFKSETVLSIAGLLALISCFFVKPNKDYLTYIDFSSLSILLTLMIIIAGLSKIGLFSMAADFIISRAKSMTSICISLVLLPFFFSMLITNDVALITFVPFCIITLNMAISDEKVLNRYLIAIVTLQTIAANLGSMMLPMGNPQNLYLYNLSKLSLKDFVGLILPYSALSLVLLIVSCLLLVKFNKKYEASSIQRIKERSKSIEESSQDMTQKKDLPLVQGLVLGLLFMIALMTVFHIIPYYVSLTITLITTIFLDKKLIKEADWALLTTFIFFFIFIGNMGRIASFRHVINSILAGHESLIAILASQVISNVPCAILLSGFTDHYKALIVGCNLGGLGSLIASMASLISYKLLTAHNKRIRLNYLAFFSLANIIFLILLLIEYFILNF